MLPPIISTTKKAAAPQPKASPPDDTGKKISIKNLISESKSAAQGVNEPQPAIIRETISRDFSAEELLEVWIEFAAEVKEESPRISVTLTAVTPELLPDKTVILRLDNSALKEAFDHNFRARMEHYLRDRLQNNTLTLKTSVETTERGEIL